MEGENAVAMVHNLLYYRTNIVNSSMERSPKALHVTYRGLWMTSTHTDLYSLVTPTNTYYTKHATLLQSLCGKVIKFVACWFFSK